MCINQNVPGGSPPSVGSDANPVTRPRRRRKALILLAATLAIGGTALGVAVARSAPVRIEVPGALRRDNASIEPSGIAWAAALDRYLVVSDDTGTEERKHRPWVFGMSRQGVMDPEPIVIQGIDELNDAEAICAGPDGTFFLTTSHSANKKGKTSPSRRMLLHMRLAGRALSVVGRLDLTLVRDGNGDGILAIAGLDPGGSLDIEAITYRQGALLVGLKSPLTSGGAAAILRLDGAVEALRTGHVTPGSLTRLRVAALDVSRPNGVVHRGISDLLALPDGSMVVLANSPKGLPSDGGGAMYWIRPGGGPPSLLHEYSGLKPEGVTVAADGKELVLVFDNDLEPPLWVRVPLPR